MFTNESNKNIATLSPSSDEFTKQSQPSIEKRPICKYTKISQQQRNQLLHKVFFCQQKIKDAAKELGINYSSAKTILHIHRKRFRFQNSKDIDSSKHICSYRSIESLASSSKDSSVLSENGTKSGMKSQSSNSASSLSLIKIIASQGGKIINNDSSVLLASSSSSTSMESAHQWSSKAKNALSSSTSSNQKNSQFTHRAKSHSGLSSSSSSQSSATSCSSKSAMLGNSNTLPLSNNFIDRRQSQLSNTSEFSGISSSSQIMNANATDLAALLTSSFQFLTNPFLQQQQQSPQQNPMLPLSINDQLTFLNMCYPQQMLTQFFMPSFSPI